MRVDISKQNYVRILGLKKQMITAFTQMDRPDIVEIVNSLNFNELIYLHIMGFNEMTLFDSLRKDFTLTSFAIGKTDLDVIKKTLLEFKKKAGWGTR